MNENYLISFNIDGINYVPVVKRLCSSEQLKNISGDFIFIDFINEINIDALKNDIVIYCLNKSTGLFEKQDIVKASEMKFAYSCFFSLLKDENYNHNNLEINNMSYINRSNSLYALYLLLNNQSNISLLLNRIAKMQAKPNISDEESKLLSKYIDVDFTKFIDNKDEVGEYKNERVLVRN